MSDKIIKGTAWDDEITDTHILDPDQFGPVLEQEVVEAIDRSRAILERAREEAGKIRQRAKDLLATVAVEKEEERKSGFEEGYQEGLAQVTEKLAQAEARHEAILKEAEPEIVRMILESVEKILGRELEKGAVADVVRQAIGRAVGQKIVIRVNPGDFLTVQQRMADLTTAVDSTQSLVLKEDEAVAAGGCVIETELGSVDARLEIQLAAIRRAFGVE